MATPESYLSSLETEIKKKVVIGGTSSSSLEVLMKAYEIFDQDTRLTQIIEKLNLVNTKLDTIINSINAENSKLDSIDSDLQSLNDKIDKLGNNIYRGGF